MVTRAAEAQVIPGDWDWAEFNIPESLDYYQDEYNRNLIDKGMPAHLTPMNTTKQFHRSAKEFFEKVRQQKLKRPTPPRGGGADVMPIPPAPISVPVPAHIRGGGGRPRPDKPGGFTDPGKDSYGPHKADGGLINFYRYGGFI